MKKDIAKQQAKAELIITPPLAKITEDIKTKITRTALDNIEIGELLIKAKKIVEHGSWEMYYKSIGIGKQTAERYMHIAKHPEIQKLKAEGKLDGLNMNAILEKVDYRIISRSTKENAKKQLENRLNYKPVGHDKFNYKACTKPAVFKKEYSTLLDEYHKLEQELKDLITT